MVSFTNHSNTISIDRLPSKTKIGKDSQYVKISHLCEPEFSSATKTFLFFIKNAKNNHSSASNWWKYTKSCFKDNAKIFSKNSTIREILQF